MSVTIESVLVRDNELTAAAIDEEVVVLSVRAGAYFGFNHVAGKIWNMLEEPCRVGEIFEQLAEQHDVDEETVARDVTPFLQTLVEQRLLLVIDPGNTR